MRKLRRSIITLFVMSLVIVSAYYINKVVTKHEDEVFEAQRVERVEEVTAATNEYMEEIQQLSQMSKDEIQAFIDEKAYVEKPVSESADNESVSDNSESESDEAQTEGYVDPWADTENFVYMTPGSENENAEESDAESEAKLEEKLDELEQNLEGDNEETKEDKASEEDKATKEGEEDESEIIEYYQPEYTLAMRQEYRTSMEETELWIESDQKTLDESDEDFSKLKIACLGDSITEAANLLEEENYQQYTYPTRLGEILNAEEIYNFGIGGSSYGRFWYEPFCERYQAIPEDADLIIIMGGTNDGYCMSEDLVGNLEERAPRTLYGDVNDLMAGLKENYPDAEVIFITPMPNLLHDVLREERENLLSQQVVVDCVTTLASEYGYEIIDLYNSNFFDSHDADICAEYIPDSVHPNQEGYTMLAKHIAAEIIRMHEKRDAEEASVDEETEKNKDASEETEPTPSPSPTKGPSKTVIYGRDE